MSSKRLLALAGAAALLGGCATPYYYDNYGYNDGYYYREAPVYREYPAYPGYVYGPGYYYPRTYIAPSVGFSIGYSSGWHRH
jgi:hypothetical protein